MIKDAVTIRLTRSIGVNKEVALVKLDKFNHLEGQPVIVIYNNEDGSVDAITAIGVKNGIGRDCYSIISTSGFYVVNEVLDERYADISELINNGIYVCRTNELTDWCIVKTDSTGEKRKPNFDLPSEFIVQELKSGYRWFYKDGLLYREDDFFSRDEVLKVIQNEILGFIPINITSEIIGGNVYEKGTSIKNLELKITVTNLTNEDITNKCNIEIKDKKGNLITIRYISADGKYTIAGEYKENETFNISASYSLGGENESTNNCNVNLIFTDATYYGKSEQLNKLLYAGEGNIEFNINLTDEKSILIVPSDYEIFQHIYDINGLDYINDYIIESNVKYFEDKETLYTVYTKDISVTITNFKQVFSYE